MDLSCSKAGFLGHQGQICATLDGWARSRGWHAVDASRPLDEVAGTVMAQVSAALLTTG
jgi:hypothetical protein